MKVLKRITLAHGAGGKETGEIIEKFFVNLFKIKKVGDGIGLDDLEDSATIPLSGGGYLAFTIDSYTVNPIFFPGGNIGKLAATGTINDLAVMGAKPLAVMDSMVVEEGFSVEDLEKILNSMKEVLERYNIALIGGDFKVMPKDQVDKVVLTMAGIGLIPKGRLIKDSYVKPGDKIVVTGPIGEHGATIMIAQAGLEAEAPTIKSDCAPIIDAIEAAFTIGGIHAAKDPTRGGLAMALNDWAKKAKVSIIVWEEKVPLREEVRIYSEMLGIDPFTLASEGIALIAVEQDRAEELVNKLKNIGYKEAEIIGEVRKEREGYVLVETISGGLRILEPPVGEIVPRIC